MKLMRPKCLRNFENELRLREGQIENDLDLILLFLQYEQNKIELWRALSLKILSFSTTILVAIFISGQKC